MLDDAKHVIGVEASNVEKLIIENVENGKADKFQVIQSFGNYISSLVYDKDTASLYIGDNYGHLHQYKVTTTSKSCKKVRDFGDLGIEAINSSERFLNIVFFGGSDSKIRVLDLSTGELLPGHLETSIEYIFSIQVCAKSHDEIYLAVSGGDAEYSDEKTDLFNITGLFLKVSVILEKYFSENLIDEIESFLHLGSNVRSQTNTIEKPKTEKDSYKSKISKMHSKYNDPIGS